MDKVKVGDEVLVEQAWEDDKGNYHDEYAKVLGVNEDKTLNLQFHEGLPLELHEFLAGCEFYEEDVSVQK